MKISNRKKPPRPVTQERTETDSVPLVSDKPKIKTKYLASERKTIKVDPPVKELIKIISNLEDMENYLLVDKMVEFWMENKLEDREKRIVEKMLETKFDR